jgi:LmbE family N-acetylglucosaminyl deacetylase
VNNHAALVVAAHPDDEVLGCGGTVKKLCDQGFDVKVAFMTDGESSRSNVDIAPLIERRREAAERASEILGSNVIHWGDFPDNGMDAIPLLTVVKRVEQIIRDTSPSIVLTHWHGDLNVDHQVVARAVVTATRPQIGSTVKRVLAFEIPSSSEWAFGLPNQFVPNTFVAVDSTFSAKLQALECYSSELRHPPHPRSMESITATALKCGHSVGYRYAEAFVLIRSVE